MEIHLPLNSSSPACSAKHLYSLPERLWADDEDEDVLGGGQRHAGLLLYSGVQTSTTLIWLASLVGCDVMWEASKSYASQTNGFN